MTQMTQMTQTGIADMTEVGKDEQMTTDARGLCGRAMGAPGAAGPLRAGAATRWIIAAAGVLMQLALGTIYGWSVFVTPLAQLNGWTRTQVTLTFTLALFVLGLAAFGAGAWLDRRGPRVVGVAAGLVYGLGVFLAGFSLHRLGLLYLSYGLLGGIGLGLGYIVPVATLVKWFPDRRGLISGIAVAGFGGGALLTALLAPPLIRSWGVPPTFRLLGALYLVLIVGSAAVLRNPPRGYARPAGRVARHRRRARPRPPSRSARRCARGSGMRCGWCCAWLSCPARR